MSSTLNDFLIYSEGITDVWVWSSPSPYPIPVFPLCQLRSLKEISFQLCSGSEMPKKNLQLSPFANIVSQEATWFSNSLPDALIKM